MSDADNAIDFETFFGGNTAPSGVVDVTSFDEAGMKTMSLVDDVIDFFKAFKIVPQIQASPFGPNKILVFLPPKSARAAAMKNMSAAQLRTLGLYHVVKFAEFNAAIDACNGAATNLTTAVRGALLSYTCNIATVRSNGKVNDFDFYRGVGQPPRAGYPKFELVYPVGYGIPTGSIAVVQLNRMLELPPQSANESLANEKAVFAPAAGRKDDFAESKRSSNEELRTLWSEHTKYTALFIVAAIDKLHTLGAIKERLLKNQDDIAAFVVKMVQSQSEEDLPPSKLSEFKKALATKLKEHIAGAETLVGALSLVAGTSREGQAGKIGDYKRALQEKLAPVKGTILERRYDEKEERELPLPRLTAPTTVLDAAIWNWYKNGVEIVNLIAHSDYIVDTSSDVHGWLLSMFYLHLQQTIVEALAYYVRADKVWLDAVDEASDHMLKFADGMTHMFWGTRGIAVTFVHED
jgi:hypothetical protein